MSTKTAGPIKSSNKRAFAALKLAYGWYVGLGFAIALLLPSDALGKVPLLGQVVDVIARLIPSVDRLGALSSFPDVTRTFVALMWTLQPVSSLILFLAAPWGSLRPPPDTRSRVLLALAVPVGAFLLLYYPFVYEEVGVGRLGYSSGRGTAALTLMMESRIALATFGCAVLVVSSLFQVYLLRAIVSLAGLHKVHRGLR